MQESGTPPPPPTPAPGGDCGFSNWKGDNYCDDDNNNAGCEWDGGDCCGDNINTQYCSDCECLDPGQIGECEYPLWEGDGYCDDGNNNRFCNWDGGDCCSHNVNKAFCQECECLDPKYQGTH